MSSTATLVIPRRKRFWRFVKRADQPPALGPTPPKVTHFDALKQFWRDIHGKEVQTAGTYSYTWTADQFGHICAGILANLGTTRIAGGLEYGWRAYREGEGIWETLRAAAVEPPFDAGIEWGLGVAIVSTAYWEWRSYRQEVKAYREAVKKNMSQFPLDEELLRWNAMAATLYMWIGAALGYSFHLPFMWALAWSLPAYVVAVCSASFWLRQKIVWQKAGLPYLFRLSEAVQRISKDDATKLQNLIEQAVAQEAGAAPRQVVIAGPIGSRRTQLTAGIGTEFAFKNNKVRYLSFDTLLEFAMARSDDLGPDNIKYWPWRDAQVVIIDDVGPLLRTDAAESRANLDWFEAILGNELQDAAKNLALCHTVWVIGDLSPRADGMMLAHAGPLLNTGSETSRGGGQKTSSAEDSEASPTGAVRAAPAILPTLFDFANAIRRYCRGQQGNVLVIELGAPPAVGVRRGRPPGAAVEAVRLV